MGVRSEGNEAEQDAQCAGDKNFSVGVIVESAAVNLSRCGEHGKKHCSVKKYIGCHAHTL
jgi:hypothetical protein